MRQSREEKEAKEMTIKTIAEVAGRIYFLERARDQYIIQKKTKEAKRLGRALKELYWVLGVKIA